MNFIDPAFREGGKVVLLTGPFGDPERVLTLARPMTISEAIETHELAFRLPTIAVLNGEPVLRAQWPAQSVGRDDRLAFIAVPGGGGEGTGKQVLGLVAMIALSVAAPGIGTAVAGALQLTGTAAAIAASLASAAVIAGGSMLLNAMIPSVAESSETGTDIFSVSGASNEARPLGVMPVLYGRLRYPPPHASRPYSEFQGNDQYLYQLLAVSCGKAGIEKVEIGDAEAWNSADGYSDIFDDVEIQIIQPGQSITLFPANVVTSIDVAGQPVPAPPTKLGPFIVNGAGTLIDKIAVDFAFPGGLFTVDGRKIADNAAELRADYREIDAAGDPVGGWEVLFEETITLKTRTPQRFTRRAAVPAGRYEVQFYSEAAIDDGTTAVNQAAWVGLRGYLAGFETPADCTLLAIKMRANEQLSQASASQIRVTAQRYLPTYDAGEEEWSAPAATSSIAWAAADVLRNASYGLGLDDTAFDAAGLAALHETWDGRGDTFNHVFESAWTAKDALTAILAAGRAQHVRMGGVIGFNRLEPKLIRRAVFSLRNIVRGSFSHKLVLFDEEKPDSVNVAYFDETVWAMREVLCQLAALGSDLPQREEMIGITNHDQAWREGVTRAAMNAYQREFVSFSSEWEGKLLIRGEPILVMHPFVEGVHQATARGVAGAVITLDRDVPEPDGDAYLILRGKDGREWGPCLVDSVGGREWTLDADDLADVVDDMGTIASILPSDVSEPMHVLVCEGETRPFNGLVVSAVPGNDGRVAVLAVIDAPEVHAADGTEITPSPWDTPDLPDKVPLRPVIYGLVAELRAGTSGLELDAMWQPAAGAETYVAQVSYDDEESWTPVHNGTANRFTTSVLPQALVLRVRGIGALGGGWVKKTFDAGDVPDIRWKLSDFDPSIAERVAFLTRSVIEHRKAIQETIFRVREKSLIHEGAFVELRRSLAVQHGQDRAYFDEQIVAALAYTDEGVDAVAAQITSLGLEVHDPVSGLEATADSLAATILTVSGQGATLTAQGSLLNAIDLSLGSISGGAKFFAEGLASPGGGWFRTGFGAYAGDGVTKGDAMFYVEAKTDGSGRGVFVGQRMNFADSGGNIYAMFDAATGGYFNTARIANLEVGNLRLKGGGYLGIDGDDFLLNASIIRGLIGNNAVTDVDEDLTLANPGSSVGAPNMTEATPVGGFPYGTRWWEIGSITVSYVELGMGIGAFVRITIPSQVTDWWCFLAVQIAGRWHVLNGRFLGTSSGSSDFSAPLFGGLMPGNSGTYAVKLFVGNNSATLGTFSVHSDSKFLRDQAEK